ncbi:Pyochelin synthetase F [Alloalcanivorax dieselolei B5]|uniref:Pyochelin synthetase F n=1 Tax=Alcanivorax dieselolei (strain DSM 16502 / CGMCC 1.3690 / MCCC 1A00001 / B-5) TaxID=930169 RepID=K0CGR7_ALCDB|nr:class I SAM-dependent methyltransferase [Alloalcanivorax dieselolei]AFT70781.1 Pyochelin synthetase F [Alloalcanivorax dieselolei B5]GGJ97685.1 hypothetical protein GCM10007426_28490 [Alloalcanivorax dieselolei]
MIIEPADAHLAGVAGVRRHGRPVVEPERIPEVMQHLEALGRLAIRDGLHRCGWHHSERLPRRDLTARLGVAHRHAGLLRSWLSALMSAGMLEDTDGSLGWRDGAPSPDFSVTAPSELEWAYADLGFPPIMARVHARALASLPALLRDTLGIEQVLFADGRVLEALAAYQDNLFTTYLNSACAHLARRLAEARAAGPLRVVELGAGAGLTSAAVLRELDGIEVDYLFSDLSRLFTVAARDRFSATPGMRYGLLDINTALTAQGVTAAGVDLVVAGNVLHNACDLRQTLAHIRQVLAPGGGLLFTESCRDNHAVLTCMQFLLSPAPGVAAPGSSDRRGASGSLFLNLTGWRDTLREAGFEPLLVLPETASPLAAAGQHLFLARVGDWDMGAV